LFLVFVAFLLATQSVEACTQPAVAVSYSGPDAAGHGTATVSYTFATGDAGRLVSLYLDGSSIESISPGITSGVWNRALNVTCLSTGNHTLRADARHRAGDLRISEHRLAGAAAVEPLAARPANRHGGTGDTFRRMGRAAQYGVLAGRPRPGRRVRHGLRDME
jgi:hypothetical protein